MIVRLLLAILLCACGRDANPGGDKAKPARYKLGVLAMGRIQYEVRVDSSQYARVDTVQVDSIRFVPEFDSIRNRLGRPAYYEIVQGRLRFKLSHEDMLINRLPAIRVGGVYRIEYGYRDVWHAAHGIWSLQDVKEINPTQASE